MPTLFTCCFHLVSFLFPSLSRANQRVLGSYFLLSLCYSVHKYDLFIPLLWLATSMLQSLGRWFSLPSTYGAP